MLFRKKPVVINAFCLGVDNIPDWFMDRVSANDIVLYDIATPSGYCEIKTLEGVMRGEHGDYVIRGVKGEIYPCKPDIFVATYEEEPEWKVYQLNECDWYMAQDLESAIARAMHDTGLTRDEVATEPQEVSDELLDELMFMDDDGETRRTFREELRERVQANPEVQCFASTEV